MADRKTIHLKLLTDISDHIVPESAEYENLITLMINYVPKGILSRNKTFLAKLQCLETKGHLAPGNYGALKKMAEESGNKDLIGIIKKAEDEIKKVEGSSEISNSTAATASSTPEEPSTKRKREDDDSDPLYTTINKRNYYDTSGKNGYLLILNSKNNRKDTDKDVANIKGFFEDRLKFDTYDPRSYEGEDLSTDALVNYLKSTQESLNGAMSKKYYCFVCIILYHGNEDGIATSDGIKSVDEVIKMFNNDQIPNFAGRPKLFFIQACRGLSTNHGVVVDDADDMNEGDVQDEADDLVRIPHEADTLVAYATTHGKKAMRRSGIGSWFVHQTVEEFKENYKTDHVEDMLITVREKVSRMHSPNLDTMQMPCVQSTLTRRLLLR